MLKYLEEGEGRGLGAIAPLNLGIAPPIFQHIGEKERSMAFKIRQNAFPAGALPRTPHRQYRRTVRS